MHTAISFIPLAIWFVLGHVIDRRAKRPAARARFAALSLRGKIASQVRLARIASAYQAGVLALCGGLAMAGVLSFGGWLAVTAACGLVLAVNLHQLRNTLTARRAYDDLGPLAYLAEVRHAFGTPAVT